jgi:acyl transferase domain-containing protein
VNALTQAFRATTERTHFCLLGTAKTNVGHLESAAGVTGLIKTALAIEHGVIPASLHFASPNPRIDFASSPFRVVTERTEWPRRDHPRRAGVSSFGVGGTNAHVVLEAVPPPTLEPSTEPQLLVLSARTLEALEDSTTRLAAHLRAHPELRLTDVAWTLQIGRRSFEHRRFLVAEGTAEAARLLRRRDRQRVFTSCPASAAPSSPDKLTQIGLRWLAGEEINWAEQPRDGAPRKVSLPTYAFQRKRYWIEPLRQLKLLRRPILRCRWNCPAHRLRAIRLSC